MIPDLLSKLLPNLISTFVGVFLAIPAGMFVNRRMQRRAERKEEARRAVEERQHIRLLMKSARENHEHLVVIRAQRKDDLLFVHLNTGLDISVYEAARQRMMESIDSLELRTAFISYFAVLASIEKLAAEHRSYILSHEASRPHMGLAKVYHTTLESLLNTAEARYRRLKKLVGLAQSREEEAAVGARV